MVKALICFCYRHENIRITFKKMWLVGSEEINLTGLKGVHIVAGYKRAFALLYPGYLRFFVPVQVRIKIGLVLLLRYNAAVMSNWNSKL